MQLKDKVRDFLDKKCDTLVLEFYSDTIEKLKEANDFGCSIESPVEQLFYIEWQFRRFKKNESDSFFLEPQYSDNTTKGFILDFYVNIVEEVINWKEMLDPKKSDIITSTTYPKLGIEIDGHIWHEKTKEQVAKDKKRERILIANGWQLLRFSGSEVYNNTAKCVDEALEIANKLRTKYFNELREKFKNKKGKNEAKLD